MTDNSAIGTQARDAIEGLIAKIQAAWAEGDASQFAELFSENAIFVPFNGARLFGPKAIEEFHERPFAAELRGSKLHVDIADVRALADGLYLIATSGGPVRPGQQRGAGGTQSHIVQHQGDRWAFVLFQNTPVLTMGAA